MTRCCRRDINETVWCYHADKFWVLAECSALKTLGIGERSQFPTDRPQLLRYHVAYINSLKTTFCKPGLQESGNDTSRGFTNFMLELSAVTTWVTKGFKIFTLHFRLQLLKASSLHTGLWLEPLNLKQPTKGRMPEFMLENFPPATLKLVALLTFEVPSRRLAHFS